MTKIYVASSWRNEYHTMAVARLQAANFEVYDFKNPVPGNHGFRWQDTDPDFNPERCTVAELETIYEHPVARRGAALDMAALETCDGCLMVLPCGNSSHLELGYVIGRGKPGVIWAPEPIKADLMYVLAQYMSDQLTKCIAYLERHGR